MEREVDNLKYVNPQFVKLWLDKIDLEPSLKIHLFFGSKISKRTGFNIPFADFGYSSTSILINIR